MDRFPPNSGSDVLRAKEQFSLLDLVPLEDLQQLQDTLDEINDVITIITDPLGNPLTMPSNDLRVCNLVRRSPSDLLECAQSPQTLAKMLPEKPETPIYCQACQSLGVLHAAVPIVVNRIHLANWWISQRSASELTVEKLARAAEEIEIDPDQLMRELDTLPQGNEATFHRALAWIDNLAKRITQLGYQNLVLSRDVSKLHQVESELQHYKTQIDRLVQERTAELISANKQLQLEVMERDLVEEQIARKSKLLDAINQVLQLTLTDRSDFAMASAFLSAAQELTASPFGFIVERQKDQWQVMAISQPAKEPGRPRPAVYQEDFELTGIWRHLVESRKPLITSEPMSRSDWHPLPKGYPDIHFLLAVPLQHNDAISGFLALANNPDGYALVDQTDIQALALAFMEALLRKRMEQAKHLSEKRLNLALDSANEGLWDYFPQSGKIYYSPRWYTMLGYMPDEFPNSMETWATLAHPDDLPVLEGTLENAANGSEEAFGVELRMLTQGGQWRWIQARGRTVERDSKGIVVRIVGTLNDISKYKQVELALQKANEELQRLAALDDLTQIANRRRFDDRLTQEWRRARRERKPLAVIICDIDFFKDYNDTYGHLKGDDTLHDVAQAINNTLKRPMDMVARYGGEEFAVVLPNTNIKGAMRVANEVKAAIDALGIDHTASKVHSKVTLSFGVAAVIPSPKKSPKILVEAADQALYQAKNQGRNRIVKIAGENAERVAPSEEEDPPPPADDAEPEH